MNRLNRFGMSLAVISALGLGLTGCGSSDSNTASTTPAPVTKAIDVTKTVTVERGKVYGATVTDSTEPTNQTATQEDGKNSYTFENEIVYPVKVEGGFIDVDGDGQYSEGDLELDMELVSYEENVTAISTYISKDDAGKYIPSEADRQAKLDELANQLNDADATAKEIEAFASDLLKLPSEQTTKAQMATNAIYAEMIDENSTDINLGEVSTRVKKFEVMVENNSSLQMLKPSDMAMALEKALIADPDMNPYTDDAMTTVTETDVSSKLEEVNSSTSLPDTNTSDSSEATDYMNSMNTENNSSDS